MSTFAERLMHVECLIDSAVRRGGRCPDDVTLVAISKTHPAEAVAEAVAAGQKVFGESRVQEARSKIAESPGSARWHFIGHLQGNKVRQALPLFELIHGIDSLDLAGDVDRVAGELGLRPRVLLEVNVSGEASKHGFSEERLREQMESLLALPRLEIEGFMTIPPLSSDPELARPYFAKLRAVRDRLEEEFSVKLPTLSMGMSGDFVIAIEEGATLVRVGTALFGRRERQ
jgi:PLP dependent protein